MKTTNVLLLFSFFSIFFNIKSSTDTSGYISTGNSLVTTNEGYAQYLSSPIAVPDTFILVVGCGNNQITGNVIKDDIYQEGDTIEVTFVYAPSTGFVTISSGGTFTFTNQEGFFGTATFTYRICENKNKDKCDETEVTIFIVNDYDCDGIPDEKDIDDDNDGILDIDDGLISDLDNDGFPNYIDIDSDNDGIVDNIEGQPEGNYSEPSWTDTNKNGWDDMYDPDNNGTYFELADTDNDGYPDYIDTDSDDDKIDDIVEGHDANFDGTADITPSGSDLDEDGLDDAFDTVNGWQNKNNSTGSNAPLPDQNKNSVRDWREVVEIKPVPGDGGNTGGVEQSLIIFPNPSTGSFNLIIPKEIVDQEIKLELFDLNGKLLFEKYIVSSKNTINPGNIGSGIFLIKLKSNTLNYSLRLIINHQ